VRKQVYRDHANGKVELFDYIEMLFNLIRWHSHISGYFPEVFERLSNLDFPYNRGHP
jgi:hypothetical protein